MIVRIVALFLAFLFTDVIVAVGIGRDQLNANREAPIKEAQILATDSKMKELVDQHVTPIRHSKIRAYALMSLMFDTDKLGIQYDASGTKTAIETVKTRSGNCISLANTFVAMARYAGLDSHFISVKVPDSWRENNETYYLSKHITAAVKLNARETGFMEFGWFGAREKIRSHQVSDLRAYSEFYNNLGVDHLSDGRLNLAVLYLKKSIEMDNANHLSWNNLGVVYRRLGKLDDAETAYKRALQIERDNESTLINLAKLYQDKGDSGFAEKYRKKLKKYRSRNPYYLNNLAEKELNNNNHKEAVKLAKKAIRKQKNEHRFYYTLAKAYAYLGEKKKVEKSLEKAMRISDSAEAQNRYHSKLDYIRTFIN